jgi:hypothetical protein
MEAEMLVCKSRCRVAGHDYEIFVYSRPDGSHIAKTFFTPDDVIINDGVSLDEVLAKHQSLLPLAVASRMILRDFLCRF